LKFLAINGKQGLAALTNEKEDIFDQIHADNIVKSGVGFTFTTRIKKSAATLM
jgi:hypothetical protein